MTDSTTEAETPSPDEAVAALHELLEARQRVEEAGRSISEQIREMILVLESAGWTRVQIAQEMGVTKGRIGQILGARRVAPSASG